METALHDLRYAVRVLLKHPGFALATILVLALGIGANTAIFSVVNAVLLRPLPFPQPDRLVHIWHTPPKKSFPGMDRFSVSAANYFDWQAQNHVFERTSIYSFGNFTLTGSGQPESVAAGQVSPEFFSVLQAKPMLGRIFSPGDTQAGNDNEVVLSHRYWKEHFGSDSNIVGKQISLDGQSRTIIGVMGPETRLPSWAQIWTLRTFTPREKAVRGEHHYLVIGRLKPGIGLKQAQAEMDTISKRLEKQYPADDNGWGALVVPLRDDVVGDIRPALLILLGAVVLVLLIACANVANLVLAKTLSRSKEIAIRAALGASRRRVFQQLLSETLLLSLVGGALGLLVAKFGVDLIVKFLGDKLPRATEVGLDGWVLGFTFLVSVLTGIVAGIAPAWHLTRTDVNEALKQGISRTDSGASGRGTRNVLVVSEVALSLMLLIGAGLMVRSLWLLRNVDPGFDPHELISMNVNVPKTKFTDPAKQSQHVEELLGRVRSLPGVRSAAIIDDLPLTGGSHQPIAIEGHPAASLADQPEVDVRIATAGYFETMKIPLKQGRTFNTDDRQDSLPVAVVSESMAKRFWPGESPIGKRLTLTFFPGKVRQIVGVVGDVKQNGLEVREAAPTLYWPMEQAIAPAPGLGEFHGFGMMLVARTDGRPAIAAPAITNAVREMDRDHSLLDVRTMEDALSESLEQQRFNMLLLATFAGVALLLAAVGIYSVLAYSVGQRLHEIGIRMALGAQIKDVLRLVVIEGMKPSVIGMMIGIAGALALGRVLTSLIFGVSTTDPLTYVAVLMLLVLVCFLASIVPAYRAAKVDPIRTLRE